MTRGSDLDRLPRGDLTLAHKDTTKMVCDLKCVYDRFRADIGLRDYEIMIVIRLGIISASERSMSAQSIS